MYVNKVVKMAEKMPKPRIFMMGNGKSVLPKFTKHFCETIVNDVLDGHCKGYEEFALGCAAMIEAISRGTIDLEEHPRNVVKRMWDDVNNVTTAPNKVTDIMRLASER